MKRWFTFLLGIMAAIGLAACGKEEEPDFWHPLETESFIRSMIHDQGDCYEVDRLSWYTKKEDVRERFSQYETVYEDETMMTYRAEGMLEDQTPVIQDITVGFKNEDGYPLCSVVVHFYMEDDSSMEESSSIEDDKAKNLADSLFEQLDELIEGQEKDLEEMAIRYGRGYEKESGSYVLVQYMEDCIQPAKDIPWEDYSDITIGLWLPEDPVKAILDGVEKTAS